jgi:membrane protease YdiL (CAAX protease family)
LGWTLLAFALGAALVGGSVLWLNWNQPDAVPDPQEDAWFALQLIALNAVQVAVLALAARLAGWPVGQYLGLTRPPTRDVAYGIVALAVVLGALEILTHLLGRESVTPFQSDAYRAARAAGLLPLMWLAFVVAAPVGEEVTFRGFLFRGWEASRLGVFGTILLTSLIFAAAHTQYDWFGSFQTFCMGLLFGWLRWRSGSTTLTILLHTVVNFVSTVWTALKVEGIV